MGYTAVDVGELEGEGPAGAVRKVRRALGARAFGFNYITLPPAARATSTITRRTVRRRSTSSSAAPA
jgi:hypothetical protein